MTAGIVPRAFLVGLVLTAVVVGQVFSQDRQVRRNPAGEPSAIGSGQRVALVIGNGAYRYAVPLHNTANDARDMADAVKRIGFDLVDGKALVDLDRSGLEQAIRRFGKSIRGGAVGLFYYSGHGMQMDGKNYLIPISANVESRTDIKYELVEIDVVLDERSNANSQLNIVILDACRINPFGGKGLRSLSGGLAQLSAPHGTFIAYSTAPGRTAVDGNGRNSPYTEALARMIVQPGVRIEDVFIKVRQEVMKSTGGEQEPWEQGSLHGAFYLAGPATSTGASEVEPAVGSDKEPLFWQSIMNEGNPAAFEDYLRKYPNGEYAVLARLRIEALRKESLRLLPADQIPAAPSILVSPDSKQDRFISEKKLIVVQVGTFKNKQEAEKLQKELQRKGITVVVKSSADPKSGQIYLVQTEPVDSMGMAATLCEQLKLVPHAKPKIIPMAGQ